MTILGLQGGRFVASSLVFLYHFAWSASREKYFGETTSILLKLAGFGGVSGVAFFFVLSGTLMYLVHNKDYGQARKSFSFLKKRFVRIYPSYWFVFLLVSGVALLSPQARGALPDSFWSLAKALLLIPQVTADGEFGAPVISVAWTLQFEVLFYIGFAIALSSRLSLLGIVVIYLFFLTWRFLDPSSSQCIKFLGSPVSLLFLLGISIGYICNKTSLLQRSVSRLMYVSAAIAVGGTIIGFILNVNFWAWCFWVFYGVLSALIVFALVCQGGTTGPDLFDRLIEVLGNSSYALYLLHLPIISIVFKLYFSLGFSVSLSGAVMLLFTTYLICVSASVCFYTAVERPLLRVLRTFLK